MYTHRKQTHTSTKTHLLDFYDVFLFIQNANVIILFTQQNKQYICGFPTVNQKIRIQRV